MIHLQIVEFDVDRLGRWRDGSGWGWLTARVAGEVTFGLRLSVELSTSLHNHLGIVSDLYCRPRSHEVDER